MNTKLPISKFFTVAALFMLAVTIAPLTFAVADGHRGGGGHGEGHGGGGERHEWREGGWHNGWHDHREGWWWVTGGLWYPYPTAIYPYPEPYLPPVSYTVVQPAPPAPVVVQPQPSVWYYCDRPAGYYPYIPSCPGGWRSVAATPPSGAPY